MKKLILALCLLIPSFVRADSHTVIWDPVTLGADGQPVVGLLGYKLYMSLIAGTYGATPRATVVENTTSITETLPGRYYLVVRAYNASGESANSNEVSFQVLPKVPAPPTSFRVVP